MPDTPEKPAKKAAAKKAAKKAPAKKAGAKKSAAKKAAPGGRAATSSPRARGAKRAPTREEIEQRAYYIGESEGGDPVENWLRAERELSE